MQGTLDEAASFCFNILDAGRRGQVAKEDFLAAATGCAAVPLPDQPGSNQQWAQALAAGKLFPPCASSCSPRICILSDPVVAARAIVVLHDQFESHHPETMLYLRAIADNVCSRVCQEYLSHGTVCIMSVLTKALTAITILQA